MEAANLVRRVWVSGRVQGVGFRAATVAQARSYPSVSGYVQNLPDGRVQAAFCGPADAVLALVAWCSKGPPSAQVTRLEVREERAEEVQDAPEFQSGFKVR